MQRRYLFEMKCGLKEAHRKEFMAGREEKTVKKIVSV
jgi:hypothetical protein